jgi:type I restriction enzyme M protein
MNRVQARGGWRMRGQKNSLSTGKRFTTQQSLNNAIWGICDVLRRSNCAGALQYIPELTWILFLRILDEQEMYELEDARVQGVKFLPSIESPYGWQDWAAPDGLKRIEIQSRGAGALFSFINSEMLPYLRSLRGRSNATPRQKVVSEIISNVDRVHIDSERDLADVLNRVHKINSKNIDATHIFALSQVYEGLLRKMGEKANDGGQFFTPREIIRVIVKVISPKLGETVYDPCCGTGGFLAQAYAHMLASLTPRPNKEALKILRHETFYGREKENLIYPIALANLVLHGIDEPHIWHGNTLTNLEIYGGLFPDAPGSFNVVLTNPPFGGKEGKDAQENFVYKTISTQVLFLQHVIDKLSLGGRCGIVLDEGVLFRTNQAAFVQTKRKLLKECNLWCIVSLPNGVFTGAGAGVKTNLLFFTKGQRTEKIWYYDLSDIKVGKKTPFTQERFEEFFRLLPGRADSERSWTVTRREIEARNYDLKAVNPHVVKTEDNRTSEQLLSLIESKGQIVAKLISQLRDLS